MKKILIAFDGSYYSVAALNYAIAFAKTENAMIEGVFLEDITAYHQFSPIFDAPDMVGLAEEVLQELKSTSQQSIQENVEKFAGACTEKKVQYRVERESGIPSIELVQKSLFADLIVLGSVTYFSNLSYRTDISLVSDILSRAHCPVIVVPEQWHPVQHVNFTFDGSASSVFAMRQFLYLFPNLVEQSSISIISVVGKEDEKVEHEEEALAFLKLYKPEFDREVLVGKPSDELLHYAEISGHSMVVMGAFGRSAFSKLFKSSLGRKIVEARTVPVFVAHE